MIPGEVIEPENNHFRLNPPSLREGGRGDGDFKNALPTHSIDAVYPRLWYLLCISSHWTIESVKGFTGTMSVFSPTEISYMQSQRLGRLATVGPDGQPHVVPVAFRYNPELDAIDVGGHGFAKRKKYRDVLKDPRVAFVIDDVPSVNPWVARGIELRGLAEVLATGGEEIMRGFDPEMFRIRPKRIVSWGIEEGYPTGNARTVG
jgi:pyridoxamine 5'-phosphate oxidase family protein